MTSIDRSIRRRKSCVGIGAGSLCAAALLVVLVASATAATSATFTSKRFGYSIALPAKWKTSMIAQVEFKPFGPCLKNVARSRATSLGGAPAFAFGQLCPIGDVTMIVALHKRRGYIFIFQSSPQNNDASDHRLFEQMRKAVRFVG